jgi:hypothetical protein
MMMKMIVQDAVSAMRAPSELTRAHTALHRSEVGAAQWTVAVETNDSADVDVAVFEKLKMTKRPRQHTLVEKQIPPATMMTMKKMDQKMQMQKQISSCV